MNEKLKFKDDETGERVLCFHDSGGDQIRVSIEGSRSTGSYFMIVSINGGDAIGLSCQEALRFAVSILNEVTCFPRFQPFGGMASFKSDPNVKTRRIP